MIGRLIGRLGGIVRRYRGAGARLNGRLNGRRVPIRQLGVYRNRRRRLWSGAQRIFVWGCLRPPRTHRLSYWPFDRPFDRPLDTPPPVDSSKAPPSPSACGVIRSNPLYIVIYVYWHRITPGGRLRCRRRCAQPRRCAPSGAWSGGRSGDMASRGARTQVRRSAKVAAEPWSRGGVGGGVMLE